ncbi:MAG: L,D-transpeptidase family protein [Rhodospirillaceae bacterium]|jgi:L,D-transpeptidase YcbB|nr:L,D-transpeptidase family protein [Rhodospirillaceae bacterium]MBT6117892.1 L,D-transpeptidase family protein [Rhodospirillaceae bacterium]
MRLFRRSDLAALVVCCLFAAPAAADHLSEALAAQLATGAGQMTSERDERDLAVLDAFYRERNMATVWVDETVGVGPTARQTAEVIADMDRNGLDPRNYGLDGIRSLMAASTPEDLAALEIRLSLAVIRLASDLSAGRLEPSKVDPEHYLTPTGVVPADVIRRAAQAPDVALFLASFEPQQDEYRRLRDTLAHYRALAAAGGWPKVAEGEETLDPGMTDPRVVQLRARLRAEGDLDPYEDLTAQGGPADFYDEPLKSALVTFQNRHGLEPDGRVGPATLAALNVTAEERVDQIMLNMERRRWMEDDLGRRYVFVNLADFHTKVVDGAKTVFVSRVVIGRPYFRTPVFSKDMTYVVVNPYWNVTPSIARNELLPKIKEDPGYLAAHNYELLSGWSEEAVPLDPRSIDWSTVSKSSFGYKIRQRPGEGNALGRVKFMFPNSHNIYMHDTPSKSLFNKYERTFSHGCIRVHKPREFAEVVLASQGWSREKIDAAIASEQSQVISLAEALPVHITYLTAWTNKDGTVHFRDDVYGRDKTLKAALLGPGVSL